tara:strand:+ start:650 stop:1186 length:537 start_codon:yes stop_codon:yes gene_type:complete
MLKNKWLYAGLFIFLFPFFLLINLNDNASEIANQNTNLEDVSNAEMEKVIELNPDIFPMRIALANRYFEEFNYSSALPHFMHVAQNSEDLELKSLALAQIGWMVHDSGDTITSLNYIEEALAISPESLLAKTYLGIILIQQEETRKEGYEILTFLKADPTLSNEDLEIIQEILSIYEN